MFHLQIQTPLPRLDDYPPLNMTAHAVFPGARSSALKHLTPLRVNPSTPEDVQRQFDHTLCASPSTTEDDLYLLVVLQGDQQEDDHRKWLEKCNMPPWCDLQPWGRKRSSEDEGRSGLKPLACQRLVKWQRWVWTHALTEWRLEPLLFVPVQCSGFHHCCGQGQARPPSNRQLKHYMEIPPYARCQVHLTLAPQSC